MKTIKKLSNLNIAKDNFKEVLGSYNYNLSSLECYYLVKKEEANRLTLEGEYVGKTYDNLDAIEGILNDSHKQLVKNIAC